MYQPHSLIPVIELDRIDPQMIQMPSDIRAQYYNPDAHFHHQQPQINQINQPHPSHITEHATPRIRFHHALAQHHHHHIRPSPYRQPSYRYEDLARRYHYDYEVLGLSHRPQVQQPRSMTPPAPITTPKEPKKENKAKVVNMDGGFDCRICLEPLHTIRNQSKEILASPCGHVFCGGCIRTALTVRPSCPICQKRADLSQLLQLFL